MALNSSFKVASLDEIELMKRKVTALLEKRGMKVDHPKLIEYCIKAGAKISSTNGNITFPQKMQEEYLELVPREFLLAGIDPKYDLKIPHPKGLFYGRPVTGAMYTYTEGDQYREVELADLGEWTRLTQHLEHMDFYSLLTLKAKDFPPEAIDINSMFTVFKNTTKHGWLQPYEAENVKWLLEMAATRIGGREELRRRPIVSMISCAMNPLYIKYMDAEAIYQGALYGVPIHCCTLPTSGANAPITQPGTVLMMAAECLAMVVMAQCVAPGIPCIATPEHFAMDMSSMYTLQSTVEVNWGRMLAVQLMQDGYGIPVHLFGGGSDAYKVGEESIFNQAVTAYGDVLSGCTILGDLGQLETGKTIAPVQLIIDNDVLGMLKVLKRGYVIDDDTLAVDEIMHLNGETDSFITLEHSYRHFKEIYRAKTFTYSSRTAWLERGCKDMVDRAKEFYNQLKAQYKEVTLSEEMAQELLELKKAAEKSLLMNA